MRAHEPDTETTSTIQIRELFQSEWFNTDLLLLEDDESNQNSIPLDRETSHKVALQNSVRLALGLVRVFQKYCNCCRPEDRQSISSICLDDIFVTLSESSGCQTGENDSWDEVSKAAELRRQGSENNETREKGTPTTFKSGPRDERFELRAGFFSSFDNKGADAYEEFITYAGNSKQVRGAPLVKAYVDQTRDADGIEFGMGYFSDLSQNQEQMQQNTKTETPIQASPKKSTTTSAKKRILLSLDIISPVSIDTTQQRNIQNLDETGSIRLIGCLLYSVFSKGNEPPIHFQSKSFVVESPRPGFDAKNAWRGDETEGRKSKSPLSGDSTILLQLLDSNTFPISICHFLSDMIDVGPEGKASNPFKTFDEIIQDLEEMKAQPHLFLFDRPNNAVTSSPITSVFGQQYYGRLKELTQLLAVPTRLEATDASQSPHERVEAVFLSGRAGSGKSHLIKKCGEFLSAQGWIVVSEKFDRGLEHKSQVS